jgi:hypothetical protein
MLTTMKMITPRRIVSVDRISDSRRGLFRMERENEEAESVECPQHGYIRITRVDCRTV